MSIKIGVVGKGKSGIFSDFNIMSLNYKALQEISAIVKTNYGFEPTESILEIISDFTNLCAKTMISQNEEKSYERKIKNGADMTSFIMVAFLQNISVGDEDLSHAIELISTFSHENKDAVQLIIDSKEFVENVDMFIGKEDNISIVKRIAALIVDYLEYKKKETNKEKHLPPECNKNECQADTESYCKCSSDDKIVDFIKRKAERIEEKSKQQLVELEITEDENGNTFCNMPEGISEEDKTRILSMLGYEIKK